MVGRGETEAEQGTRQTTIMVVEDNDDIRDLLALVLEEEGHRVVSVGDGGKVIQTAIAEQPDLITLDLALPGKDGWELLRELQEHRETRQIPVLVISAYTREIEAPLRRHASAVIPKPFYITQVAGEVAALLKGKPARRRRLREPKPPPPQAPETP